MDKTNKETHGMLNLINGNLTSFETLGSRFSVRRTVHPVGQGGFHTEEMHNNDPKGLPQLQIVYDCGTKTDLQSLAPDAFDPGFKGLNEQIDILFLSHLDADHVNRVPDLKRTYGIARVVLPLLDDECKVATFLSSVAAGLNGMSIEDFNNLVFNPEKFFGKSTPILRVKPSPLNSHGDGDDNLGSITIENLNESKDIPSFQPLKSSKFPLWRFIPFCFDEKNRQLLFLKKLRQCPAAKEVVKTLSDKNNLSEFWLAWVENKENLEILKCIYNSLPGGTNGNSLMLYSGPEHAQQNISIERCFPDNNFETENSKRAGCLYLGDMNLKAGNRKKPPFKVVQYILQRIQTCEDNLDLIQIPHHGSQRSFHDKLLALNTSVKYYFLSYGIGNSYKHPSPSVIKKLGDKAIQVTNETSGFCTQYTFPDVNKKDSSQK